MKEYEEKNKKNFAHFQRIFPNMFNTGRRYHGFEVFDIDDMEFFFQTFPFEDEIDELWGVKYSEPYKIYIDFRMPLPKPRAVDEDGYMIFCGKKVRRLPLTPAGPQIKDKLSLFEYQLWLNKTNELDLNFLAA